MREARRPMNSDLSSVLFLSELSKFFNRFGDIERALRQAQGKLCLARGMCIMAA